ncbi:alpha-D-xyloside xylohydrolase [Granulicella rosea]|uniref:Alpha-D-xyloside xylohydrolase n=1 Tax=Granulicella rosea TaxID=474952 RepID=A0A239M0P8_9BACT|nr:TIM-barrel domain-containing protein [Granulicella rosea]SNT35688.1 alpha-D-xyloside xylohydrolase [Granulicella rosea]
MTNINRRQLGKGLAGGLAAGLLGTGRSSAAPRPSQIDAAWTPVAPGVWKSTLGSPEAITPVKGRLVAPKLTALGSMQHADKPPLAVPVGSVSARGVSVELPLHTNEEIYGFGLQFFSVQQRGKKRVTRVNADPHMDTGDSHAPVPFYVTSHGYGVLIDTARYATFYCGETKPKPTQAAAAVNSGDVPTTTTELYSRNPADEASAKVLVDVPAAQGVDVYLFAGPTILEAVRRYNLFSGGGIAPPEWGLGFWYRTQSNATDKQVLALMKEFRERNIPCDVLGLEAGWQTHAYSCTYAWHKDRFPDPASFVRQAKALDLHVNLWEHAFIHPSSPVFTPMVDLAGDKGVWGGLVPDFEDPHARKVYGDYQGKALLDMGIDGFKLDECDNSDYTRGWSFPELSKFPSGADGEQMHSIFGLRYQSALWDQFEQRKRPTYCLVRSSGALAAPYPFVLYSDLYEHRQFVRALVNSGFSGLLWCPEVRDAKSDEDLIRRLQTVVFSPLAMINGWYIPNPPWKQLDRKKNNANELMPQWESLEAKCREIIGWRMMIVPYLRAAFAKYAEDGAPPFRALALDWPDQPEVAKIDDAWMVGDRMLVAPLFAGETSGRTLMLPPGTWHDFWTGTVMHGGTKVQIASSFEKIPVYVKAGSVMPLAAVTNSTADPHRRQLTVQVFGDGSLPFEMAGSLKLSWDQAAKKGSLMQSGSEAYTVASWSVKG